MTSPRRRTILFALFFFGLAACSSTRPPADVQADGGAAAQEDAGDPNQPPAGFLTPPSGSYLTLQFKGLINSEDTVYGDSSNIITGIGHLATRAGEQTLDLTDSDGIYAYDYDYGDSGRYLFATGRRAAAGATSMRGSLTDASVFFTAGSATALNPASHLIDPVSASVRAIDYVVRKDQTTLYKVCYQGLADTGAQAFVDHSANHTFTPGESLVLWANVPLVTDPATIRSRCTSCTSYQGVPCLCQIGTAKFDCADWDAEAAKEGGELSCNPPADFLTPPASGDWATFKLIGTIAAEDEDSPVFGESSITVGGTTVTASQFGYATEYDPGTESDILYLSFYDEQSDPSGILRLTRLDFYVTPAALVAAKAAGTNPIVLDESNAMADAIRITAYPSGGSYLYRVCPFAVFRGETAGRAYDCPAGNTTFGIGERLEIEGNLVLQTNVTSADVGVPLEADGCYCANDNGTVACSTLPE
jgi:hypothetical protein